MRYLIKSTVKVDFFVEAENADKAENKAWEVLEDIDLMGIPIKDVDYVIADEVRVYHENGLAAQ